MTLIRKLPGVVSVSPPARIKPASLAGNANPVAEKERVVIIIERLKAWLKSPAVPAPKIVELTGLSRVRIQGLIQRGAFERRNGELVVASVEQHFARRLSVLTAAAKSRNPSKLKRASQE